MQRAGRRRWWLAALVPLAPAAWTLVSAHVAEMTTDVTFLASDELQGRVATTPGSELARNYIMSRLFNAGFAEHVSTQAIGGGGTNILAWVDGVGALNSEYVLVGAHYDHVPYQDLSRCMHRGADEGDAGVCNGATDNATSVALLLDVAQHFRESAPTPRRKVYFLFWDREEYDLGGSVKYRNSTIPPWPQPVVYVNYDIQGANLLPSLRDTTFAVGASSGGGRLLSAVNDAAASEPGLRLRHLSEALAMYRSDYATFVEPNVVRKENPFLALGLPRIPTVYFSDSSGPCYHTPHDETDAVDFQKLDRQARMGVRLLRDLATGPRPSIQELPPKSQEFGNRVGLFMQWLPPYPPVPPPTFQDAAEFLDLARKASCDDALPAETRAQLVVERQTLEAIVDAGAAAYDPVNDGETVAFAAMAASTALESAECDAFLDGGVPSCPP